MLNNGGPSTYRLCGLDVRSEVPLSAPPATGGPADVVVLWAGRRIPPSGHPPGTVLADFRTAERAWYTLTRADDGFCLRVHGCCDFDITPDLRVVRCHPAPDTSPELVAMLVGGVVVAVLLELSGRFVLHGSAVEVDAQAVGILGHSGMGKSTLAALLCGAGARLVSDDVLRVDRTEAGVVCRAGGRELRLRSQARYLADRLPGTEARETIDGRLAVCGRASERDRVVLRALLLPQWSDGDGGLSVHPIDPAEAMLALTRYPRVMGWVDPARIAARFHAAADVAAVVPLHRCDLPHGRVIDEMRSQEVLRALGLLSVPE